MTSRRCIFVVDDDPAHCALVREVLHDAEYDVEIATSGRDALGRMAEDRLPDLILLDLIMPEMDGWAFMQHRRNDPALAAIPVVVMTGAGNHTLLRAPVASGYLNKPLVADRLLQVIGRCLTMTRSGRSQNDTGTGLAS